MHSSSRNWRELPRKAKSECPKLFYKFWAEQDSFRITLTDLVAIWECSLDRGSIIQKAKFQRCSIDPSESNAQLRVLLEKLEQSLQSGGNELFRAQDLATQAVHLKTELGLPKPLKALSWTFELEPQDAGELAEQLLRPCLHEASVAKQKLESLLRVIKDKDHVLSRLLEKVDSSAIDLSLIFPGITGFKSRKGRVTVRDAQKHVPGISEFDYEKWSSGFDNDSPYAGFDQMGINNLVSGCERCPKHTVKQHCDWLKRLPADGGKMTASSVDVKKPAKRKSPGSPPNGNPSDGESDFETQATPPHLRKVKTKSKEANRSRSSASSPDSERDKRPAKKPKRGRADGNGSDSTSLSASPELPSSRRSQDSRSPPNQTITEQPNTGSDTETASEGDTLELRPRFETTSTPHGGKRKLGKLTSQIPKRQRTLSPPPSAAERQASHPSSVEANQETSSKRQTSSNLQTQAPERDGGKASKQHQSLSNQSSTYGGEMETASDSDDLDGHRHDRKLKSRGGSNSTSNKVKERDQDNNSSNKPPKLGRLPKAQTSRLPSNSDTESDTKPNTRPNPKSKATNSNPYTSITTKSKPSDPDSDTATASASNSDAETTSQPAHSKNSKINTKINTTDHHETSESKPPSQRNNPSHPRFRSTPAPSTQSDSTPAPEQDVNERPPAREETAEERANCRREELKKRINPGGGGVRKTRKF